ncbi:3-deoxy-8-phosphooctulonate synthase [Candidatus Velamenicoccus archaeovorus]|uniref:2-dehydro-3-deoxyphosphooctonate aldolase n=1 Tax=Velamenicoccus archaeovorus TaxID=1930593 RepID=A0A410P2J5_VELA1|nr:3-deoxy-8-phosphooctulonate synthase [Candidatus Velamenicoccus archaeovorus]QAT16415.1 3-deoxy-8-phosphooctulonate synthase [Candidatus Velamenicoccus archaeovorus]
MKTRKVSIGAVEIGGGLPLVLLAGPCVIESEKAVMTEAERLKAVCRQAGIPLVFKSSYDKANRTSLSSFRGPGIRQGLKVLQRVKKTFGIPVLSDVHSADEAKAAGEVLDCLQIPAFLCRQTDILVAAARTKKAINIKKGQFLAPWNMDEVIKKIVSSGNRKILLTERGVSFGYNNLVVDFRSLAIMRQLGYPVIFDATHSVQLPGGRGTSSGGEKKYVAALSRAAVAFGCDGLFLEVHQRPEKALCDGPNMLSLSELPRLLETVREIGRLADGARKTNE